MPPIPTLVKAAFADWRDDKASRLAAALAYYTVFSLVPLLVLLIAIAGLVFGRDVAQGHLFDEIEGLIGPRGADLLQGAIEAAAAEEKGGPAMALGAVLLLLGATGVFGQLKDGLNTIWEVAPRPGRGLVGLVVDRFASFTMVLGIGFLLLVSLAASAWLTTVETTLGGTASWPRPVAFGLDLLLSVALITLLFAMIYRILPEVEIAWRDVWLGALLTAMLFTGGKFVIAFYLGSGSVGSAFGAAGGLVILLVWVYYSAQILFFGAELTQVYARHRGSRIQPDEDAVAAAGATGGDHAHPRDAARLR